MSFMDRMKDAGLGHLTEEEAMDQLKVEKIREEWQKDHKDLFARLDAKSAKFQKQQKTRGQED